jgi:prolyl-tRNA synthetase
LRNEKTYTAVDLSEFERLISQTPGFIKAMWCGDRACEDAIKEKTGATSRCIPFNEEPVSDKCICCGKEARTLVYWGKAY